MSLRSSDSIILIGCKGCGKSTLGKMLADEWKLDFFDIDEIILQMTGLSSKDVYLKKGASGFMQIEEIVCKKLIENFGEKRIVIAADTGLCDNAPAISELSSLGGFVFLKYDLQKSVKKVMDNVFKRDDGSFANVPTYVTLQLPKPKKISDIKDVVTQTFENRYARYESIADISVLLKEESPKEENFQLLLQAL